MGQHDIGIGQPVTLRLVQQVMDADQGLPLLRFGGRGAGTGLLNLTETRQIIFAPRSAAALLMISRLLALPSALPNWGTKAYWWARKH